ncbi:MAG: hypothetical protein WD512_03775 [Candidatus Paceibacterota bacterium]
MRNINQREAKELIKKYEKSLIAAVKAGFGRYKNEILPQISLTCKRTKANIIRDFILQEIKKLNFNGLKVHHANQNKEDLAIILLEKKIALRIKKIDKNRKSRNNKTQQTKSFLGQTLELDLLDVVPTYCDLGYKLDKTGTNIEIVTVVCRLGKVVMWECILSDKGIGTVSQQSHLYEEEPVTKKKRISAKKSNSAGITKIG